MVVNPVYVIISSSILKRPYWSGNPLVLSTLIVSLSVPIPEVIVVYPTIVSGVKLFNF